MEKIKVKRSKRKTISIKVNSFGEVIISAPKNASETKIVEFVNKHQDWIDEKVKRVKNILAVNQEIIEYKKIFFLGNKYNVCYVDGIKEIILNEKELYVPTKYQKKIKEHLKKWYLTYFNELIVNRTIKLLEKLNLKYSQIVAINSKNRWGSCSSEKKLSFNYKILMLSPDLIDYIIVHEVCHLKELNHSPKFWNLVNQILPNYKELNKKLKNCGFLLKNL